MNLLKAIEESYKRWRHSKGFGVHSPFAYNLVKMAINPASGYSYYGYHDIDTACSRLGKGAGYRRIWQDARLLFRIANQLRCCRLLFHAPCPDVWKSVGKALAIPAISVKDGKSHATSTGDILLLRGVFTPQGELSRILKTGVPIMAVDPSEEVSEELMRFHDDGLLLHGKRIVIAIPNPDMRFTSYSMRM